MQKRITKDLLTYLPARALPALAGFLTVPIYTHLFSPAQFGDYALAIAASEFLLLATVTCFGQAGVRFFSAYELKSDLSSYFAALFGSVGLVTLGTAAASAGLLAVFRSMLSADLYSLLRAGVVLYVASAFSTTLLDVLRAQERGSWYSVIWIGESYGGIVFGLILVLVFKMDIGGLIWGQTLGLLLTIVPLVTLTTRAVPIRATHLHRSDLKQFWGFAMPFAIGNIAFWTLSLSDRYIVELFRGSYEVGLYSVASKISARSIQLLVSLFILVPVPMTCRLWEERGRQATEETLTAFTRLFFIMVIPAVVGISVLAAPLVRVLTDEAYFDGARAIGLLACAAMSLGLIELSRIGCLVTNHTGPIARNQILAAGSGLILNFLLIPPLGFLGAALAAAVSSFLLVGLQSISSARFLTWRWPLGSLWRVLVASAVMSASILLVQAGLRSDTTPWRVVSLLLSVAVGALTYAVALSIMGEISPRHLLDLFYNRGRDPAAESITGGLTQK